MLMLLKNRECKLFHRVDCAVLILSVHLLVLDWENTVVSREPNWLLH